MPTDQFNVDDGAPGEALPMGVRIAGGPDGREDDRFTFQLIAQYLEWNAPATTIHFGNARLVDESCSPVVHTVHIEPGGTFKLDNLLAVLGERACDLIMLNRTGWRNHVPPTREARQQMAANDVGVEVQVGGARVGTMRPGMPCLIPQASGAALKAIGDVKATVTIYAFPY